MKRTSFILLFIFTLVQTAPAIKSMCNKMAVTIFNPDEEKGTEEEGFSKADEMEQKKNFFQQSIPSFTSVATIIPEGVCGNKDKLPRPIFDRFTPPPNAIAQ
jgi:hypothetical protein